jgi:hypothetical protein
MSNERHPRKAVIASPVGLTLNLKAKSRTRRQRQRALAEIVDHTPKRRNDLLPKFGGVLRTHRRVGPGAASRSQGGSSASRADTRQHRKVRRVPADPYQ